MSTKKAILKAKCIFPRTNNQNFPQELGYTKQSAEYRYLPNNFSHNPNFMNEFMKEKKKNDRMHLIVRHVQKLKMNMRNCYEYDEEEEKLVLISEEKALERLYMMCQKRMHLYKKDTSLSESSTSMKSEESTSVTKVSVRTKKNIVPSQFSKE